MKEEDLKFEELFKDLNEDYVFDYSLEDNIIEVISRPLDYKLQLIKTRRRSRFGLIASFILFAVYLLLLSVYSEPENGNSWFQALIPTLMAIAISSMGMNIIQLNWKSKKM